MVSSPTCPVCHKPMPLYPGKERTFLCCGQVAIKNGNQVIYDPLPVKDAPKKETD